MATYIIPFGGGAITNGKDWAIGLSKEEGIGRCNTALQQTKKYPDAIIVIGCGTSKPYQRSNNEAIVMKNYFSKNGINNIITNPKGYSTITEIKSVLEIIKPVRKDILIMCSSWYYLPRIWLICKIYFRVKATIKLKSHWNTSSYMYHLFRETLSLGKFFLITLPQYYFKKSSL